MQAEKHNTFFHVYTVSVVLNLRDRTLYLNSYAVVVGAGNSREWDYVKGHHGQSGKKYPEVRRLSWGSLASGCLICGGKRRSLFKRLISDINSTYVYLYSYVYIHISRVY